jgi:septum formation protein
LTLASASPRRAALLREAGFEFDVAAPRVDESVPPGMSPAEAALQLAVRKARAVEAPLVLAADTLIDLDGEILGKPRDADDAHWMLGALAGRAHAVVTGVAVRRGARTRAAAERTVVRFRDLSPSEIEAYVATGEPLDKAGAYAIQGGARGFVERFEGPLDNVIGLPMGLVRRLLREAS